MKGNFITGAGYLAQGAKLIFKPGIGRYVIIPLTINILLFASLIYYSYQQVNVWISMLMGWLPGWMDFLGGLVWLLFTLMTLIIMAFTFNIVASLIASPFNSLLSEAVERHLMGVETQGNGGSILLEMPHSIGRELVKLGYYLPRVLLIFVLGMIPPITLIAPLLWFSFGSWMLAIQYLDYPMDNHKVSFRDMLTRLKQQRLTPLGYGAITLVAMMVPILNFFVIPAAVAGATALYVEHEGINNVR